MSFRLVGLVTHCRISEILETRYSSDQSNIQLFSGHGYHFARFYNQYSGMSFALPRIHPPSGVMQRVP